VLFRSQLSGNDKDFEREILKQFVYQAPDELSQLDTFIRENDFDSIRRTAHSLKSTVGYVGLAEELHPYLECIEKDAVVEKTTDFVVNFKHVKLKCEAALNEVKTLLDNGLL